jgi:LAO/AO transport system kinase
MPETLTERLRRGDRLALSRLLTKVARGEGVADVLASLGPPTRPARVVALTGGGGVGKSTLTGKLIEPIRADGLTVAVLACDPQSPLSGGALLGDRFRMPARADDDGTFIRSLAAVGGQGALADNLPHLVRLLEAFGFDVVLLETVGAGQGDTAVRGLADAVVVLLQPETGDDLQWEKAGLLEVADVVAINKADLPGAERVEAQVVASLSLTPGPTPRVLRVSGRTGEGVAELWRAVAALPLRRGGRGDPRELLRLAQALLAGRFGAGGPEVAEVVGRWQRGEAATEAAAAELLRRLAEPA